MRSRLWGPWDSTNHTPRVPSELSPFSGLPESVPKILAQGSRRGAVEEGRKP